MPSFICAIEKLILWGILHFKDSRCEAEQDATAIIRGEVDKRISGEKKAQADRQKDRQTASQPGKQTDRPTDRQTDRDRQTVRQTDTHTHQKGPGPCKKTMFSLDLCFFPGTKIGSGKLKQLHLPWKTSYRQQTISHRILRHEVVESQPLPSSKINNSTLPNREDESRRVKQVGCVKIFPGSTY